MSDKSPRKNINTTFVIDYLVLESSLLDSFQSKEATCCLFKNISASESCPFESRKESNYKELKEEIQQHSQKLEQQGKELTHFEKAGFFMRRIYIDTEKQNYISEVKRQ